jgi:hypothetical protein
MRSSRLGRLVRLSPPLFATLLFAAIAHGDAATDKARAKEAYDRGTAAHQRGDFATAAAEYALADEIAPSPVALQAALDEAIKADDPGIGTELLERANRAPITGALEKSVNAARTAFAHRAGKIHLTCPANNTCLATIDGRAATIDKQTWTRAGQHTIVFQVGDESQQKLVDVKADQTLDVAPQEKQPASPPPTPTSSPSSSGATPPTPPTLAPSAPPPDARTPTSTPTPTPTPTPLITTTDRPSRLPVILLATGTVLVGGASIWSALDTQSQHKKFTDAGCDKVAAVNCSNLASNGSAAQDRTNIMLGVTAALAVATGVVAIITFTGGSNDNTTKVGAVVLPSGAAATFSQQF